MKVGIIGAGNIGGGIARNLISAGHDIRIADAKGPDAIRDQFAGTGVKAVELAEIVSDVDAIIVSVPVIAMPDLAELLKDIPSNVTLIDTSNYYPFRDGQLAELDGGKPESIWVSEALGRPVTKAFNAALAQTQVAKGLPRGSPNRIALPVAGDSEHDKRVAMQLVEDAGFDAVDAGSLAESWRQQPGTPAYCTELQSDALREALGLANKDKAPENRETLIKQFFAGGDSLTHEAIVALNRSGTAPA
jgi:predicted dinucleotide-binding enzyme